jgi:hypothetical protein
MHAIRLRAVRTAVIAAACLASVQSSVKTWLGREPQIEQHLKTAQIVTLEDIGTGVTKPKRARLVPDTPFSSLTWKVLPPGERDGYWESYKSEIAAYELDKLLGLDMVPPAVERQIDGETGAAIMWIDGVKSVKDLGGKVPSGPAWDKPIRRMLMFDNLIGNPDRNSGNILVGAPGELILIDHSRAFTTDRSLERKIARVDGELWDRIAAVTPTQLSAVLNPWMRSASVDALLDRRKRMMSERPQIIR